MVSSAAADSALDAGRAQPRALPAWVYDHAELNRLELQRILLPSWQIACHVNSIPRAGDYVTLDIGPESVFVWRDRDRTIRAFHNVCRHRGARLVDGSGNCPGHPDLSLSRLDLSPGRRVDRRSVTRDLSNTLERADFGLKSVRVEIAFGFVFVAVSGNPPSVADTWGPLIAELAPYRFEDMVPLGPISHEIWNVDWKIAIDNYLESYHVPIGHPGLNRMFTPDYEDQTSVPTIARGISWLREQESSRWSERMYQRLVGQVVVHLPERAAPRLALLQRAAEFGDRRVSRTDGFLPGPAAGPRQMRDSQRLVRIAGRPARDARDPLSRRPHQHASQRRGPNAMRTRAARPRLRQLPAGPAFRHSSAGCWNSTIFCGNESRKCASRIRRRSLPKRR